MSPRGPTQARAAPLAATLLAALGTVTAVVQAQDSPADEHLRRGVQLRQRGEDDAALTEFRQALALGHAPRALAQEALAEQALGRWVEAEGHLEECLAAVTDPWIALHRAVLDQALATVRQHVGRLEVRGNVAGAEVRLGGAVLGLLPFSTPARVLAGMATLEVRAPGYGPVERSVTVPAGGLAREVVDLVPDIRAVPTPRGTLDVAVVAPAAPVPRRQPAEERAPGGTARTLAWVTAGGAAAVLGGAVAMQILRDIRVANYNAPACLRDGFTRMQNCHALLDASSTAETLAVTGFVVGGALAATSLVLFATLPRRAGGADRAGASRRFGCGRGPGDVGVACEGTF